MEKADGLDFSECVYNLLYKTAEECEEPKKPRLKYKSVYSDQVKEEIKKNRSSHRTMGVAEETLPQPQSFLKKHTKELKLEEQFAVARPPRERDHCCPKTVPVPRRNEMKEMPKSEATKKDFVSLNATKAVLTPALKPVIKQVDSRNGSSFQLPTSGLQPLFLNKKVERTLMLQFYGRVPPYLEQRKKEIEEEQQEYEAYVGENVEQGNMKQIADEERQKMLQGLKNNWDSLFKIYQKMSLTIDTVGKKRKKAQLEAEMKQLEKDISLLEGYPTIYLLQ
uniref:Enkurin domain-containing protein n=1 Tax=Strigamia maritima TaxID=126957 RepID=T1JAA9_STRMM